MLKNLKTSTSDAFTLMEITMVILIISIIAAFTIPSYTKAARKADERTIIVNLTAMRAAADMYTIDGAHLGTWVTLNAINTELGLSAMDIKATYTCGSAAGQTDRCTATHPDGWAIEFHDEHSGGRLHCSAGTCPSCPPQPGNCG